jgi:hypothetical protein
MMLLLRFGPRLRDYEDDDDQDEHCGESDDEVSLLQPTYDSVGGNGKVTTPEKKAFTGVPGETDGFIRNSASKRHLSERSGSTAGHRLRKNRSKAALATAV